MNAYGKFDFSTGDYILETPETTKMQENYLFNDRYYTCVFHDGNGHSRYLDPNAHYLQIVEGSTEPGFIDNTRLIYLRDDDTGEFWNAGYFPVCKDYQSFQSRQSLGYTEIMNTTNNIEASWRIFVPQGEEPVEIWTLHFKNVGNKKRNISVFAYVELSLMDVNKVQGHATYLHSILLENVNGVAARKCHMFIPHEYYSAVFLASRELASREGRMHSFKGLGRTLANPAAVERGKCNNTVSSRDAVGAALHYKTVLEKDEDDRIDFIVGAAKVNEVEKEACYYHNKYFGDNGIAVEEEFKRMIIKTNNKFGRIQIETPEPEMNILYNKWIPQLIEYGVNHCRWAVLGYRDIVQQAQGSLMIGTLKKSKERLKMALSNQYENGYAIRSFPPVYGDSKKKFADSSVWILKAISEYLKETGEIDFLKEKVVFSNGKDGTVLEHLEKAVEVFGKEIGPHGLCLMLEGDWNDSLTHVGRNGRGESVWLTQAFCYALLEMKELYEYLGQWDKSNRCTELYEEKKEALNKYAWDGKWYLRAFDDWGGTIGSADNEQGKIYLNTQSWAMLSDTVPQERLDIMLESIKNNLFTPYGYSLLTPTYTKGLIDNIGKISGLEPGCSENASVYTHGNAFLALGLLKYGYADFAFDVIKRIMPYNPENPSDAVIPYQIANGYGGVDHRYDRGRAQYGWVTGSGSWMYMLMTDYVLGARKTHDGILLKPCLPGSWDEVTFKREFRGCTYNITYKRKDKGNTIEKLLVNDCEYDHNKTIPLGSGKTYKIKVYLK